MDYKWMYNFEEDRFYTYDELLANRENNSHTGQMNRMHIKLNEEGLKDFRENILRNPEAHAIPYHDPESFVPEVFPPKDFNETREGREYARQMDDFEKDDDVKFGGENSEGDDLEYEE